MTPPLGAERSGFQSNSQVTLIATLRLNESDPTEGEVTFQFLSPFGSGMPKVLAPGESLEIQLQSESDGSLSGGSGSPSKKGKRKSFR